jgi:hypothetical protein
MNLFERLAQKRPAEAAIKQPSQNPTQRMLDFVLRWPGESISTSEMMLYGPRPKKNAEEVLKLATTLEKYGWLRPKTTPKKNMRHWNIVRRPIINPTLDG